MEKVEYESQFLQEITKRGYLKQCTNITELDALLSAQKLVAYIGFDCTAKSLHVGNLMQIMLLRIFQNCGHQPIIILGGATTRIGDPSDKDEMRKMLSDEEIEKNKAGISKVFKKFLNFSDDIDNKAIIVDNIEWLGKINYLDFLRDYGRHFSINRMLTFESVKRRLEREQPMSFLEFNYMLLQAYDFMELNKRFGCMIQFGGSEQWGNIISGIDLAHKILHKELFGITTQLITNSNGAKMGKTVSGAVWLDEDMLSSYDYWQFWRNVSDADVIRFLRIYTDISNEEIDKYKNLEGSELNKIKILLANKATEMCHGNDAAIEAEKAAMSIFSDSNSNQCDAPKIEIKRNKELEDGIALYKFLVTVKLFESGGAAKKIIEGGGVKLCGDTIIDPLKIISTKDFDENGALLLSIGKKRYYTIQLI